MSNNKHDITAIIYDKRGKILSIGKNSYIKTNPMMIKLGRPLGITNRPFIHAEIDAIIRCKNIDRAYKIFVARYNKLSQPMLAKPCEICMSGIRQTNIKIVEWTMPI